MDKHDKLAMEDKVMKDLKIAFEMLDTNNDGRVNAKEMDQMLKSLGITLNEKQIEILILQAGKSGNGLISEKEFLHWMSDHYASFMSHGGSDDMMEDFLAAFRVFDKDGNGYITRDELKKAMDVIGEPMGDDAIDRMIRAADIDNDGQINYEEFAKILI